MDYEYEGMTLACKSSQLKPCVENGGYIRVKDNDYTAHMDALQQGPLAIMMAANALQNYGGGVLTQCDCDLNHAVQLVGYGSDNGMGAASRRRSSSSAYWLIRNTGPALPNSETQQRAFSDLKS